MGGACARRREGVLGGLLFIYGNLIFIYGNLNCRFRARCLEGVEDGRPVVADGAQVALNCGGDGGFRHALTALPQVTGRRDAGGEGRGTPRRSTLGLAGRLAVPSL